MGEQVNVQSGYRFIENLSSAAFGLARNVKWPTDRNRRLNQVSDSTWIQGCQIG
jgi:hypothetical protein